MPNKCSAPGCNSNYESEPSYKTVFKFPKNDELRRKWIRSLPRENWEPSAHSVICARHFENRHILKTLTVKDKSGNVSEIPRNRWILSPEAVPTLYPNLPEYLSKKLPVGRNNPEERRRGYIARVNKEQDEWESADKIVDFKSLCDNFKDKLGDIKWLFTKFISRSYPKFLKRFKSGGVINDNQHFIQEFKVPTFCNLFANFPCTVCVKHLDLHLYDSDKLIITLSNPKQINLRHTQIGNDISLFGEGEADSDTVCKIEAPIKANLDITSSGGHIKVGYFDSENLRLKCSTGDITLDKYVGDTVTARTDIGNVIFNNVVQARSIEANVTKCGSISTNRLQGLQLQLRTKKGDISVESSYCNKSEFATYNGNLLLSNVHKDCKLNIYETGSVKMTGFDGKLDAFIKNGSVDIQLSQISNDSNLTIEDEGKLILRLSEVCQDDTCIDITSRSIAVDDNVKYIKNLVSNNICLMPLNDVACKNFIVSCNKSDVKVKTASWAEMLFSKKINEG